MTRDHLILNQSGVYHFKELEMLVLDHLRETGYSAPGVVKSVDADRVHIGNMAIELLLLCENLQLDFTECLATAYAARTGAKK